MVQGENHKRKWKNISGSERAERLGQRPPESNTLRLNLHNKIDWNSRNWPQGNDVMQWHRKQGWQKFTLAISDHICFRQYHMCQVFAKSGLNPWPYSSLFQQNFNCQYDYLWMCVSAPDENEHD